MMQTSRCAVCAAVCALQFFSRLNSRLSFFSIRRHQERRAILTPVLTDFSVRVTAAPAIIFSKNLSPDCGQPEVSEFCRALRTLTSTTNQNSPAHYNLSRSRKCIFFPLLFYFLFAVTSLPQPTEPYGKRC